MYSLVEIGKTKKTVGFEGQLRVFINDRYFDDFQNAPAVFIEYGYEKIPFFVSHFDDDKDLIQFEDVQNKEEATKLTGKPIYLRIQDVSADDNSIEELDFQVLKGWKIIDQETVLVGIIDRIESFPQQEMAIAKRDGKEIMIPLHPSLIQKISESDQKIFMQLPEGLSDI